MAVTRSQSPAKAGRSRTVGNTASAPARPRPPPTNVPGAQRAKMVRRGVDLRNENQYVPFGALGEFCLCGAQVSPGRVCNALIKNNKHDLGSHMSSMHNPGSYYNRCQAPESWSCDCRPGKSFGNFNSVKSHIRRAHSFRGPCKKLLDMPDKKIRLRRDGTVYVPGGDEDEEDEGHSGPTEECGQGLPALPEEDDDDKGNGRFGGGNGFGLGQAQVIEVGH